VKLLIENWRKFLSEDKQGTKWEPCKGWGETTTGLYGEELFSPFLEPRVGKGGWECNTQAEDLILYWLSMHVTKNEKMPTNVVALIKKVAADGNEIMQRQKGGKDLFRGSSREKVEDVMSTFKLVDWSKPLKEKHHSGNLWMAFSFGGGYKMNNPVASWSEDWEIGADFARGGPTLDFQNERKFQYIYHTSPGRGFFIDMENLYDLIDNKLQPLKITSNKETSFRSFGDYQGVDWETLLLGNIGEVIPCPMIWINMQAIRRGIPDIKKVDPELAETIVKLLTKKKEDFLSRMSKGWWKK